MPKSKLKGSWEEDFKRMYPLEYAIDGMMQSGIVDGAEIMAEVHRNEITLFIRSLLSRSRSETIKEILEWARKNRFQGMVGQGITVYVVDQRPVIFFDDLSAKLKEMLKE